MEKLAWVAVAGAAALLPPVRERVISVSKAAVGAGVGVAGAAFGGLRSIAISAVQGDSGGRSADRTDGAGQPA
ncbi:MAG: hypothetical protein M3357_05540 [Actinomycetota bacterium]|nr:hypothetical protein [Actinomycetota bacterium]